LEIKTYKDTVSARVNTPCVGCVLAHFLPPVFGARYHFYYQASSSVVTLNFAAALNFKLRVFVDHGATASLINWGSQASSELTFSSYAGALHSFFVEYVAPAGVASCPIIMPFSPSSLFWPEAISESPFLMTPA